MKPILIVAGEHSGEKYGADVVDEFKKTHPEAKFFGIGGRRMSEEGVELVASIADLSAVGIFEVLARLRHFRKIFRRLAREIRSRDPRAALLIDSPDFNLRLAKILKREGVPVLYYISPTVWAWRSGRLKTIQKTVSRMCLIFPFEKSLYEEHGIPSVFVGHPLVETVKTRLTRDAFLAKYSLSRDARLIALLPGSRRTELENHMPVLLRAARILRSRFSVQFVLLLAGSIKPQFLAGFLSDEDSDIRVLSEDGYDAIAASEVALSACGTANLEAALLGTPFISFYRLSPLTYYPFRGLLKIKDYSIVNILAGRPVVPELIQRRFRADTLAAETASLLTDELRRGRMREEFKRLSGLLGSERAGVNVARELDSLVAAEK